MKYGEIIDMSKIVKTATKSKEIEKFNIIKEEISSLHLEEKTQLWRDMVSHWAAAVNLRLRYDKAENFIELSNEISIAKQYLDCLQEYEVLLTSLTYIENIIEDDEY